ncbi:MAG TPA: phosphate ABC transporter substrate-binding protein [Gammaproteobacteria bacterium]|nr:phosphate ABC transporter substrate-binding protein [Gammaproteobacteria bacterium]
MNNTFRTLIAFTALFSSSVMAELAVIVDPSVKLDTITAEQLQRLYLHKAERYPNGVELRPIDQKSGSKRQREFADKVLGKSPTELSKYWSRRMFSGKGHPPRQYGGDAEVIQEVTATPGTIGYVDIEAVDDSVKVLLQVP